MKLTNNWLCTLILAASSGVGVVICQPSYGANDINNLGQVVGNSTTANGEQRAFLFDEGKMFDLNELIPANSGFTLNYANGINDRGQIVAGTTSNINRIFLLTPIASTSIPEPSAALGLLSLGALSAIAIKRKLKT